MAFSFIVDRDTLLAELQLCTSSVGRPPVNVVSILSSVLLHVRDDDTAALAMTDLVVTVSTQTPLKRRAGRGIVAVDAAKLVAILKHSADEAITMELNERGRLIITSGSAEFEVPTQDGMDFPTLPGLSIEDRALEATLPVATFVSLIRSTAFAASPDSVNVGGSLMKLNGVYFAVKDGEARAAATDGKRFAYASAEATGKAEGFMIQKQTTTAILKMAGDGNVTIRQATNHVFFEFGERCIAMRRDDTSFPPYEEALVAVGDMTLQADRERMIGATERAALLSMESAILLDVAPGKLTVSAVTTDGRAVDTIPVDYSGKPFRYKLSAQYLEQALSSMNSMLVSCKFTSTNINSRPVHIYPVPSDESAQYESVCVLMGYYLTEKEAL